MIEATALAPAPGASEKSVARPRLGFAGVGWIGRNRLEAIAASGFAEIAAATDLAEDLAAQVARDFEAEAVTSFEDLLAMDLDGIVIATPSALHASQAIAALEAGKAVFCQKPLARNAAETAEVVEAARRADRLLGVDFSYRHTTGMKAIRELIQRGELGDIYAVEAVFHNAYGPDKPWFYHRESSGGGCLLDLGIHLVDLALWSLDFPAIAGARGSLSFQGNPLSADGNEVEDYAAGLMELEGGTSVQLACSWRAPAGCDARIELTFFGTRGGASFRNVNGSFYDFTAEHFLPDRSRRTLASPPDDWGGRAAVDWVRRLAISPTFDPEIATTTQVAETLDRLYQRHESP